MAEFTVRSASLDDALLLGDIERAADQRYLDTVYAELLDDTAITDEVASRYCEQGRMLVAEVDDRVVAYLAWNVEADPDYFGIAQVSVLPEFGKRGIGTALMRRAIATAIGRGAEHVVLATFTEAAWNEPWYHRLGFRTIDPTDWTTWMRDVADTQDAGGLPWATRVWMQLDIETLQGGVANAGAVVRVGREVRRPTNPNSPTIHHLLRHVREAGFDGASEPLGIEPDQSERLVFVEGDVPVPPFPEWAQSNEALASTARLIRGLHDASIGFDETDATWSSELADRAGADRVDDLVICHNDVCMENIVFRDGQAVALLDFDFAAPGRRVHDLAAFARMCVPIDDDEGAGLLGWVPADRPRRLAAIADAYGLDANQRVELLECLDTTIAGGGKFVQRRVEAGEQAFIDMWNAMGGMARYDARRTYWATDREQYERALHQAAPGS